MRDITRMNTVQTVAIKTTLFGELTVPFEDGYFEDSTTVLGGKEVTFNLYIMEKSATEEAADMIARFVDGIPLMYEKAKVAIRVRADAGSELVSFFVEDQLENLDEDVLLDIFPVDTVENITTE